jgi:hypothetical protein
LTDALAVIASLAVLLGFATAVLGLIGQRRAAKALVIAERTAGKVQLISVRVDGRLSALIDRQAQLLGALHAADVPVPPGQPSGEKVKAQVQQQPHAARDDEEPQGGP